MALIDIFNNVMPLVALTWPTLTYQFGEQYVSLQNATPSIVWVPKTETFSSPVGQGGDQVGIPLGNPRPIWTRHATVEFHIWNANVDANGAEVFNGSNIASVEDLFLTLVQQLQCSVWTSNYQLKPGKWDVDMAAQVRYGAKVTITCEFLIPLPRVADQTAVVTGIPATWEMKFPDQTVVDP